MPLHISRFNLKASQTQRQSGQTLIETMIGIFILITALSSGLGLAIYALSASASSSAQLIAVNLAREGIEVARMARDSNWMYAPFIQSSGYHLTNCTYGGGVVKPCYPRAFQGPAYYLQSSTSSLRYRFVMRTSPFYWYIDVRNGVEDFMLCLQSDGTYQHNANWLGAYCNVSDGTYARQVQILTGRTSSPYTNDSNSPSAAGGHSPEKIIRSTVVWRGKGCVHFDSTVIPSALNTPCRVEVEERLTNWRDYQ